MALATSKCSGRMTRLAPFREEGSRMLPPPTRTTGMSSEVVLVRSMTSSTISVIRAQALFTRPASSFLTASALPR
jgi:hypothetical protein